MLGIRIPQLNASGRREVVCNREVEVRTSRNDPAIAINSFGSRARLPERVQKAR